jgi:hypothetical protein
MRKTKWKDFVGWRPSPPRRLQLLHSLFLPTPAVAVAGAAGEEEEDTEEEGAASRQAGAVAEWDMEAAASVVEWDTAAAASVAEWDAVAGASVEAWGMAAAWAAAALPGRDSEPVLWAEISVGDIMVTAVISGAARSSLTAFMAMAITTTAIGATDGASAATTTTDKKAPVIRGFFIRAGP